MSANRKALIVANDEYEHDGLGQLLAPSADARALAAVLGDEQVGDFDVQVMRNEPAHVIQGEIEELFSEGRPDDILLLHFSCHGLKNESGELFFATANTRPNRLGSTAVSADFVQRCLRTSRSRSVVLLLDCCYGGAFAQGVAVRAAGDVDVLGSFPSERARSGRGRAVITASSAMEYAFEGDRLADDAAPRPSVFTTALVEGLETGDADRDQDGWVSLDELYDYVFDKVRERNPHQTPSRDVEMQGDLFIARRRHPVTTPAALQPELLQAIDSPLAGIRAGAVQELARVLRGGHAGRALAARRALEDLAHDDSRRVSAAAAAVLGPAEPAPPPGRPAAGEPEPAGSPAAPLAPPVEPPQRLAAEQPPAVAEDPPAEEEAKHLRAEEPPAAAEGPPAEAKVVATRAADMPAEAEQPPAEAAGPPAVAADVSAGAAPAETEEPPAGAEDFPAAAAGEPLPSIAEDLPAWAEDPPAVGVDLPVAAGGPPAVTGEPRAALEDLPASAAAPTVGGEHPVLPESVAAAEAPAEPARPAADWLLAAAGLLAVAEAVMLFWALFVNLYVDNSFRLIQSAANTQQTLIDVAVSLAAGLCLLIPRTRGLIGTGLLLGTAVVVPSDIAIITLASEHDPLTGAGSVLLLGSEVLAVVAAVLAGLALWRAGTVRIQPRGLVGRARGRAGAWLVIALGLTGAVSFAIRLDGANQVPGFSVDITTGQVAVPLIWVTAMAVVVPVIAAAARPRPFGTALLGGWICVALGEASFLIGVTNTVFGYTLIAMAISLVPFAWTARPDRDESATPAR